MKKILITGVNGFVASHFLDFLEDNGYKFEIFGVDISEKFLYIRDYKNIKINYFQIDLLDQDKISKLLLEIHPTYILHLASYSSVAYTWEYPIKSFVNNTNIFLNLIETLHVNKLTTRVLSVGSSEEYGNVKKTEVPLKETSPLNPISPYAVARVSQEMLSKVFANSLGLDIVITRSFNHIGPRQRDSFVIPSFVKQAVDAKKQGLKKTNLYTGDISVIRDFLDVRDVVKAYFLLFEKGISGEIYNICSGNAYSLQEIINIIAKQLDIEINIIIDETRIRPNDNKIILGDNEKLKKATSWEQDFSLERSITEIINYFNNPNE